MDRQKSLAVRFWSKVTFDAPDRCWPWIAAINRGGYGKFALNNRWKVASRVAWELSVGPIPEKLFVLHRCDNPKCCNPKHLFLGTIKDNSVDSAKKGRHRNQKLTVEQLSQIKALMSDGTMPQWFVGDLFGISQSHVSAICRGTPRREI